MPKTKTRSKTKTKAKINKADSLATTKVDKTVCCSGACGSACYLCSIFKVMIALFIVMIIFWIGACFGANRPLNSSYRPMSVNKAPSIITRNSKICADAPADQLASKINSVLDSKAGNDFDKEFLLETTLNYQAALDMARLALTKSVSDDVKKLAQQIIDAQNKELTKIKVWQVDWLKTK